MESEQLTEQETALYDRQIRVWGANAQRRLSRAHVLVFGITGTIAEFCKNIVLAGVGSVTLVDDRVATEEATQANFLIPPNEELYGRKTLAEICCDSLKEFNPMVRVSIAKGDFAEFDREFYEKFDTVIVTCCSLETKKLINAKCRELPKRISFYTVNCRDYCGEIFVDLRNYKYSKKKNDETIECQMQYPSFEEAITAPWKGLPRRTSKLYFAMRVLEIFEQVKCLKQSETSISDLPSILTLKKEICEAQSLNESHIPDNLLQRLITSPKEFPPVCAIIGGTLGQEVIKAISGKGDPLKNFFFFDAMNGKGIIEDISGPNNGI